MRKWWRWLGLLVLVAGAVGGILYWRSRNRTQESTNMTAVVSVIRGDLTASISPTGEVYAPRWASLGFEVSRIELIELNVVAGQEVKKGEVLAKINPASLQRAAEQAEADVATAQKALEKVQSPSTEMDRRAAALTVTQAETALERAKASLVALKEPDLPEAEKAVRRATFGLESASLGLSMAQYSATVGKAVRDARYAVAWHERKLRDLEGLLALGQAGQEDVALEEAALAEARGLLADAQKAAGTAIDDARLKVARAEEALAKARDEMAGLQAGPTPLELARAEDSVAVADYDLAKAREEMADLDAGPDSGELKLAQARLEAAQANLEEARASLSAATMLAPFDGTIVSVGAQPGDLVSADMPVVLVADLDELRVRATIDETEISQVQVGQEVLMTFDAFPGYTFQGKVLEIPLKGTVSETIVTYAVPISLEGAEGIDIKAGMTSNLSIVTGRVTDALLVPALAIQEGDSGKVVTVQDAAGESTTTTPVEVGLTNGVYTQIVRGLNEGDQVVVEYDPYGEEMYGFGFGPGGRGAVRSETIEIGP